ncbi:MAG: bifunctional diguanylate cyclase/phosphodiesterase, partial [Acidimicrobiales bacterium]
LLLVDLNRFETIRDRYGRDQADQVLRVVGDRLRTLVRPDDLVARTGPAEFAVLLNGDEADACALADRLLARIAEPVLVRHTEINTTANIGVANVDARDDVGVVLRKADSALDAAKTAGHMCSATFDSTLHEQLEREERLEADLPAALETGQITMHFHPEVSLRTGELLGFEALARWEHPDLGLLQSEEFVGHADRIGLIRDIDDLALRTACTQMADWQRQYPDRVRSIRVNVSGSSIRSDSYVELARDLLESSQIPPESLWLEVSERELLIDGEPPLERLNDLHDIGCKILVDNFGHGLGSFSLLRKLPVDAVKIQAELIGALGVDPDASTIVSATIQLASTLGLECTAEGVESIRQAQELIELGCQRAHGHLYGEARPAAELGRIIAEGRVAPKGT